MLLWPHGDPNAVVRNVLAQPAFRNIVPTTHAAPAKTLLEIVWDWILRTLLAPLFAPIARALGASRGVGTALGIALIVVALAALAFVAFRLVLAFARPARAREVRASGALGAARSASAWRALALAAGTRGDYVTAIGALFAAALAILDERAIVAFDPTRTPGEYRRIVRRERALASIAFDALAETFVRAAFAGEAPDAEAFALAERAYARFEPAASA